MMPKDIKPDLTILREFPSHIAIINRILPIRIENGRLFAFISDERGVFVLRDLAKRFGVTAAYEIIDETELIQMIGRFYSQISSAEQVMETLSSEDFSKVATEFEKPKDLLELTDEAPIIKLLNAVLQQAVKERASDIHIEPYEEKLEVRLRVDGILRKILTATKLIHEALITRIKVMSSLDISEKRLPQDGRIRLIIGGKDIDIRVSIIPTTFGERAVLRLLDRSQGVLGLNEIGLLEKDIELFETLFDKSYGMILVTGPTGSGKTTTLYAILNRIYSIEKNIVTIEDPVEYQLKGVAQININPKIGLTFANILRSVLRHDPDVIMVGEIRDLETTEIAIQAALTGHLVLSTLHTNDAPSAITRLLDIGAEPYLIASSLQGVIAQRLVRKICSYCKRGIEVEKDIASYFGISEKRLYKGIGCEHCNQTGYFGRTAIFEILILDNEIRKMILNKSDSETIKEYAIKKGMKTLRDDGFEKAKLGITTIEEVLRVTQKTEI